MISGDRREALTIRFPSGLLAEVREHKPDGESLNDFVVRAVEEHTRRSRARQAHARVLALQRAIVRERGGPTPSSVGLLRELREGRGRRG